MVEPWVFSGKSAVSIVCREGAHGYSLAPQDYHRYHSPVSGTIGKMTDIDGEYYTVNPQAIRTSLDVYGENVRKVVPIQSDEFGLVMNVWVGAMSECFPACSKNAVEC